MKVKGRALTVEGPATDDDWRMHLEGGPNGLGLIPLLDDGSSASWGAIDIDDHSIDHPELEQRVRELGLPLRVCRSKSGGAHCYFFLVNPAPATLVVSALENWSSALGYPGEEIFPKQTERQNDENGKPRPGNWINLPYGGEWSTRYCIHQGVAISIDEFLELALRNRASRSDLDIRIPINDQSTTPAMTPKAREGRNGYLYSEGCRMQNRGHDEAVIRSKLIALNAAADPKNHPNFVEGPLEQRELDGIVKQVLKQPPGAGSEAGDRIAQLNPRHAVVMMGGKCLVLNEDYDPTTGALDISFSTPANFKERYSNQLVQIGDKWIALGRFWFEHPDRREYKAIVFEPGKETPGRYNLWRGFPLDPKPGDCDLYLDHIRQQICHDDDDLFDYVIAWLADVVQRPRRRTGVALALVGEQGSGKGVFVSEFGKLFGRHFIHIAQGKHLTHHFNGHLKDKLVVFADEAFWAGDKKSEGVLRALVTEDTLQIEMKGKDVLTMRNYIHLMVATNEVWAVPSGNKERRFLTLQVSNARLQDRPYFQALTEQMENGGRAALLDHLMNVDLSGVDLGKLPRTQATTDQKIQSAPPIQKWWLDRLLAGSILVDGSKWEESVATRIVFDETRDYIKDLGYRYRPMDAEIGTMLKRLVPGLDKRRPVSPQGREQRYYFPTLTQCRTDYDRFSGSENDWDS